MAAINRLAALMFAGAIGIGTTACASYGYGYGYHEAGYVRVDVGQIAFQNGYQRGLDRGRADARDRRSYSCERHGEFRSGDQGYRGSYGDRRLYEDRYRDGFQRGYAESYRNFDRRR